MSSDTKNLPAARRETFAIEFARHGNAASAYRAAYPDASAATVNANASVMAKEPAVVTRVAELRRARHEELLANTADLEALVSNLATGHGADLVDEDGNPVPLNELPLHTKAAIASVDFDFDDSGRVKRYKVRFPSPLDALRLLAQLRGALVERRDVTSGGRALPAPIENLPADIAAELRRRLLPADAKIIEGEIVERDPDEDLL